MTTLTYSSESEPEELVDGRWRVLGEIARGGMGVVYEGVDVVTGESVALKILRGGAERSAALRFAEEARAVACIDSPHVVRTLAAGCTGESQQPFLAMELLKGEDLGAYVARKGPLPLEEAATYVIQACEALARAHAAGIIHRDIKPSNLFRHVEPDGRVIVKIVDFGIAKSLTREETLTSSAEGAILGSPPYMSPEQIRDPRSVDHRTDIWSLGVVLFRLLTGETPWGVKRIDEVFARILGVRGLPSLVQHGLPPALDRVLARCVAPNPEERWPDAGSLARALGVFTASTTVAIETLQLPVAVTITPPPVETHGWRGWLLAAAIGVIAAVTPLVLLRSVASPAAHAPATIEEEQTPLVVPAPPTASGSVTSAVATTVAARIEAPTPPRRAPVIVRRAAPSTSARERELQPNPYAGE